MVGRKRKIKPNFMPPQWLEVSSDSDIPDFEPKRPRREDLLPGADVPLPPGERNPGADVPLPPGERNPGEVVLVST